MSFSCKIALGAALLLAAATAYAKTTMSTNGISTTGAMEAVTISTTAISTTTINGTATTGMVLPSGAIMAFDLASCPSGWSEYTAARGRFLRGIDSAGTADPSGTRVAGGVQEDAFQGHQFVTGVTVVAGAVYNVSPRQEGGGSGSTGAPTVLGSYGTPRLASETRPKNVAVLFCRKN